MACSCRRSTAKSCHENSLESRNTIFVLISCLNHTMANNGRVHTHDKRGKSYGQATSHQMPAESLSIHNQGKDKKPQAQERHESNVKACHTTTDQKKLIFLPTIAWELVAGALGAAALRAGVSTLSLWILMRLHIFKSLLHSGNINPSFLSEGWPEVAWTKSLQSHFHGRRRWVHLIFAICIVFSALCFSHQVRYYW